MTLLLITVSASGLFLLALFFIRPRDLQGEAYVKVRRVLAGDTVIVARWNRCYTIKLEAIECPEGDQHWGDRATAGLIELIAGRKVKAEVHGRDTYTRSLATLHIKDPNVGGWVNVNARMVVLGHAWVDRQRYQHLPLEQRDELDCREQWAKSRRLGLWQSADPTPP
jgi:endonuclease YncB( thermonuclease family)